MSYFPIFLNSTGLKIVVVGGGKIAERKVLTLLKYDFNISVIAPELTKKLIILAEKGKINIRERKYKKGDLKEASLVFIALSNDFIVKKISKEAKEKGILINCADDIENCDFIFPSIIKRGDLQISISTSGKFPALAAYLKKSFEKSIGMEFGDFLKILEVIRKYTAQMEKTLRKKILTKAASAKIPVWIKKNEINKIEAFLRGISSDTLRFNELDEIKNILKKKGRFLIK